MKVRRKNTRKIIKGKKPARRIRQKVPPGETLMERLEKLWNDTLTALMKQLENLWNDTHKMIDPVESNIEASRALINDKNNEINEYEVTFTESKIENIRNKMLVKREKTIKEREEYKQGAWNEIEEWKQALQAQLDNNVLPFKVLVERQLASFTGFNYDNDSRSLLIQMYNLIKSLLEREQTEEVVKDIRLMITEDTSRGTVEGYYRMKPEEKEKIFEYCVEFFNYIFAEFSRITRIDGELRARRDHQKQQGQEISSVLTQIINAVDQLIQEINRNMEALNSYQRELYPGAPVSPPLPANVNSEDESIGAKTVPLARARSV